MDRADGAGISLFSAVWLVADRGEFVRHVARSGIAERKRWTWSRSACAYADIIAVNGESIKNMKELENVRFVMKGGNVFKNEIAK